MLTSLVFTCSDELVEVERQSDTLTLLTLTDPDDLSRQQRCLIDTQKHVLLSQETVADGSVQSTIRFSEFVELAGAWWPTQIETVDAAGAPHPSGDAEVRSP